MNEGAIGALDLEATCSQCAATAVALEYRRGRNRNGGGDRVNCLPECPEGPHFDRFCKRCGFGWPEMVRKGNEATRQRGVVMNADQN